MGSHHMQSNAVVSMQNPGAHAAPTVELLAKVTDLMRDVRVRYDELEGLHEDEKASC